MTLCERVLLSVADMLAYCQKGTSSIASISSPYGRHHQRTRRGRVEPHYVISESSQPECGVPQYEIDHLQQRPGISRLNNYINND
jgi:hypothetical protein